MSTATKSKPATGTSNAPPAAPANEPAFGSGGAKPPVECFVTGADYDDIHRDLCQAEAVTRAMVHVFAGDSGLSEPSKASGLFGVLQAAVGMLKRVYSIIEKQGATPDQLRLNVEQALSLLELIEHLQVADDYEWRWSDGWYCDYFNASNSCVERALKAMNDQVKIRKEAA